MPFSFTLTDIIPATPQQIYDAWLDSRGHTKMTGSAARAKPVEGATFFAWGGYIKGKNLTLEPGKSVTFKYRVLILSGAATPEAIEQAYKAFAG